MKNGTRLFRVNSFNNRRTASIIVKNNHVDVNIKYISDFELMRLFYHDGQFFFFFLDSIRIQFFYQTFCPSQRSHWWFLVANFVSSNSWFDGM